MRNVVTEAYVTTPILCCIVLTTDSGLFAIKDYREAISQDDFNKAVRKVAESKKLEGKLEYAKI